MLSGKSPEVTGGSASRVNGDPHEPGHVGSSGINPEGDDEEPSTSAAIPRRGQRPCQIRVLLRGA